MTIKENEVVKFHYILSDITDGNETELESSYDIEPQVALVGHGQMLQGVEDEMLKHGIGDKFEVTLSAEDAYGEIKEDAVIRVPIKHLLTKRRKYTVGQIVSVNTQQGAAPATIVKVGKFNVDVDSNHPFAGRALKFAIEIMEARNASADEISHGHAHGPGGHQH